MKKIIYLILLLISILLLNTYFIKQNIITFDRSTKIYAEEEDEEDEEDREDEKVEEDEEDEDEHEEDDDEEEIQYEEVIIYEETDGDELIGEPITKIVNIVEAGYDIDTDGDKLVDALDPDPNIPQWEYYTDADNDFVANAYDKYPDDDDFSYFDFVDENKNGIIDLFETY